MHVAPRDPSVWHRVGRGRERQFYATDEDIREMLIRGLPDAWAPYQLLGTHISEDSIGLKRELFICDVENVAQCCERSGGHITWLSSAALTDSNDWDGASLSDLAAINGLVLVEHGFRRKGRLEGSRFAIVDRLKNVLNGEVAENSEYLSIYRELEREVDDAVEWASVRFLADGSPDEDTTTALMTARAAKDALERPQLWAVRPGRHLRQLRSG